MSQLCFHCSQPIENELVIYDEKKFCCKGCKTVYEILNENHLKEYYKLNAKAGVKPSEKRTRYEFLDSEEIFNKLIDYSEQGITLITFKVPTIHCTACVWLLESLKTIHKEIIYSTVNFTKKTVQIAFKNEKLKLSELAAFITELGYKPQINLETASKKTEKNNHSLLIKIGIAGFAFGNIMLLAFPEFMDSGKKDIWLNQYNYLFRTLMFILSLPVVFYCALDYYKSAWSALKRKTLNIDFPIVIGIFALFFRSCYEAYQGISNGYFDSLCGLLFFMLIGKFFQQRTYKYLAFDRDYQSFYPISVTKISESKQDHILISKLKVGDRILIRNNEIIPADSILINGDAFIDNSFITGESRLIEKKIGDKIFAGGKQVGKAIELEIIKEVKQSYLTSLWNNDAFKKQALSLDTITNNISKYFVTVILSISILSGLYWYFIEQNVSQVYQVITAILIIACPCALALSAPFTLGNAMRVLGQKKFYVKDTLTIEKLKKINHIVFDKTGTLTLNKATKISYLGAELKAEEKKYISSLIMSSNHPLSRILYKFLNIKGELLDITEYEEIIGKGIKGKVLGNQIILGSANFVNAPDSSIAETAIHLNINGNYIGKYLFKNEYRKEISQVLKKLKKYKISILSGDNNSEEETLNIIFPKDVVKRFSQSPQDKLDYINKLQKKGNKVLMLGDGLNDAGALKQADVGVAISDDINSFTPSSDAIMSGESFKYLPNIFKFSKKAIKIVYLSFFISFCYNIIGLSFAVTGKLQPLVAAILMPVSSISIVVFTTIFTLWMGRKTFK